MTNTTNINEEMAIANSMGGSFYNPQVGDAGNIAGMPGIMGCRSPLTKTSGCWDKRKLANKQSADKISKLVSILLQKTMPKTVLKEASVKLPTSISANASGGPPIAGLGDNLANNLSPGKAIAPKKNKLANGVNGLELARQSIGTVAQNLLSAKKEFPQANLDIKDTLENPRSIYRTRNSIGSARRANNLTGIEMGLFFKNNEDDETINTNTQRNASMMKYFQSKLN
tara:strand:+ start:1906 stop:2586 length:681 start_codon:yes stop_codon:yes gene_type:complete